MKNNKDIELRSEEVQEVMGQVPAWISSAAWAHSTMGKPILMALR